jgi:hypothetical protein
MKLRFHFRFWISIIFLLPVLLSCTSWQIKSISLGSFTENNVNVSISLIQATDRNYVISATFVPPKGYHLYSKDIPISGIDGLGRPTRIELTSASLMTAKGALIESAKSQTPDFEPRELQVYPAGPVTLSLPVELPPGKDWLDDEISITYMACSASTCKPPVVGKIVSVRIPGAEKSDDE